jgi:two-component system, chemotaxis family, chemotaxis protein CheY
MQKPTILIIEDDRFSSTMMQKTLHNENYPTLLAENGAEALVRLEENDMVQICLLDLNMPIMDGYIFLTEVAKGNRDLRIYITSCKSQDDFIEHAKKMNVDTKFICGYFEKPFDFKSIIDKLAKDLTQ